MANPAETAVDEKRSYDEKIHGTFMALALEQAEAALASGEFPVGCVIVHGGHVIASGMRRGTTGGTANETDHAEIIALRELDGSRCSAAPKEMTLYCTMEPCLMCYAAIILAGIGRIVYAYEDAMGGGTGCDLTSLPPLYRQSGIEIVPGVMRGRSLTLFKRFFANPDTPYWKGSYLAEYTLNA